MFHENESWTRSLPIILLGLRTIWRADFKTTPAELLYGESIRLPCDFFEDTLFQPQSEFVQTLKATIKNFKPIPFSYHSKLKPFIFKDLKDCSNVSIRTDSVLRSLQLPYHGPYKVINRSDKVFTLFIKGKNVNVSTDILKPCFSDNSSESDIESSIGEDTPNKPTKMPKKKIRFAPLPLPASTRATTGGRQVRLPVPRMMGCEITKEIVHNHHCYVILEHFLTEIIATFVRSVVTFGTNIMLISPSAQCEKNNV
ncbi:uncharacterized protein TNIN_466331 [Trichonephila inaurata madagascariensis]|uniref:Uncharacterized protein n=1 Tax=Trichonephila inaurata madagascariensis TaxID=2747483 RepID=A0A8X6XJI8_9ARAC|nr:uncharacterized protein TNIN_466331 [Trichonephila inaurata madagascariensis]